MEKVKLIEAVKLLNATVYEDEGKDAKVSLLPVKIKFIAVKEADLQAAFIAACKSLIDTPLEEHVPQAVADAYNELVPEGSTAPTVEATTAAPKPKKAAKVEEKAPTPVAEKSDKPKQAGSDKYGFRIGSASSRASELIMGNASDDDAAKIIEKEFQKELRVAKGRVKMMRRALHRKGFLKE